MNPCVRARRLSILISLTAAVAAVGAVLSGPGASAAQGWAVGDCYARADVPNDAVDLATKVSCAKPHAAQVIGGGPLSAALAAHTLAELTDQSDTALRTQLVDFSNQLCNPAHTAAGMWPQQGAAVAAGLKPPASTTGGGLLSPVLSINFGWAFPDAARYAAGDKSMICLIYRPKGTTQMAAISGDVRDFAVRSTPLGRRVCYVGSRDAGYRKVTCAKPHVDELIGFFTVRFPATLDAMTDAQWAPLDAQCQAMVDAVVGAHRTDLRGWVDADPKTNPGDPVFAQCYARRPALADGTFPNSPGGTVVGLGKRPLGSR